MEQFKIVIVEDVALELKGTEGIIRNEIPEAQIIGTAEDEKAYWKLLKQELPDLVLLDLGLGGSTTVGVEICRHTKALHPNIKVLIFTGEILNEKLWVDVLDAGADPVWQTKTGFGVEGSRCNMHWLEVVLGIDAKVFGPLHLGWTVRYKRRLMHNDGALDATWYVPGFGINDKDNIGANFNVIIDI